MNSIIWPSAHCVWPYVAKFDRLQFPHATNAPSAPAFANAANNEATNGLSETTLAYKLAGGKGWELHIKSIARALPIMLGDPRKLNASDLTSYRKYADWLQLMQKKHDIMSFRQGLPGFGEPMDGHWDGFQRINTASGQGGIFGIFRQGAHDSSRTVTINNLDPKKNTKSNQWREDSSHPVRAEHCK